MIDVTAITLSGIATVASIGSLGLSVKAIKITRQEKTYFNIETKRSENAPVELEEIVVVPNLEQGRSPSPLQTHYTTSVTYRNTSSSVKNIKSTDMQTNIEKSPFNRTAFKDSREMTQSNLSLNQNQKMNDMMNFANDIIKSNSPTSSPVLRAKNVKAMKHSVSFDIKKSESRANFEKDLELFPRISTEACIDKIDLEEINNENYFADDSYDVTTTGSGSDSEGVQI